MMDEKMLWSPDTSSSVPVYRQLADHLRNLIRFGYIKPGLKLSVRDVAKRTGCGRGSAVSAFEELKASGILVTKERSATYISQDAYQKLSASQEPDWHGIISGSKHIASSEDYFSNSFRATSTQGHKLAWFGYFPDTFEPFAPLQKSLANVAGDLSLLPQMNHFDRYGLPPLRQSVAKHLSQYGIEATEENIVIFYGWREALNVIFNSFLGFGMNFYYMKFDVVAWSGQISSIGANLHPLEYDNEGILPEELLTKIDPSRKNVLYLNPVNHFPTGITFSAERRAKLIDICTRLNVLVIENDMLRELWTDTPPPPPFKTDMKHIIYLGTFDNMPNTGMRVSWAVVPKSVRERLCDVKVQYYSTNNNILEILATDMLENNYYTQCMENIRMRLPTRLNAVEAVLRRYLTGLAEWNRANMTYHLWLKLDKKINSGEVFASVPHYIVASTISPTHPKNYILLSSLYLSLESFTEGVRDIASVLKSFSN